MKQHVLMSQPKARQAEDNIADRLFILVTMTIPKAGFMIGAVPLTLSMIMFAAVFLKNPWKSLNIPFKFGASYTVTFWVVGFLGTITALLAFGEGARALYVCSILVVIGSPLCAIAVFRIGYASAILIVSISMIAVNFYAILQWVFGISAVEIPGVTLTYGQSIAEKMIGYDFENDTGTKMPSTYQNGNYLGIFDVLGIGCLLSSFSGFNSYGKLRLLAFVSGFVGLMLCGSRSILLPFGICALVIVVVYRKQISGSAIWKKMRWPIAFLSLIAIGLLVVEREAIFHFVDRVIRQTMDDPTAVGRLPAWINAINDAFNQPVRDFLRQVILGQGHPFSFSVEGVIGCTFVLGVVSALALYVGLLLVVRKCWNLGDRVSAICLLCVVLAFCVDSSFWYMPNMMNFFLFASISVCQLQEKLLALQRLNGLSTRTNQRLGEIVDEEK